MTDLSVDRATLPDTRAQLLAAAEAALRLLDRIDAHAPEGLAFGGEVKVRRQLWAAIRGAKHEAEERAWADAADPDEAEALDELRCDLGRAPTDRDGPRFSRATARRGRSTRGAVSVRATLKKGRGQSVL